MNHQTAVPVPRPDDGSVPSPFEGVLIARERQPALALVLAVAFEAVLLDDRTDLALIVNERLSGRGWNGDDRQDRQR
jgi:hypothetical protein